MFNFFINLYMSLATGVWDDYTGVVFSDAQKTLNSLPIWNMFNNSVNVNASIDLTGISSIVAIVLGVISCVFFYLLIAKAVKALCSVFTGWFR